MAWSKLQPSYITSRSNRIHVYAPSYLDLPEVNDLYSVTINYSTMNGTSETQTFSTLTNFFSIVNGLINSGYPYVRISNSYGDYVEYTGVFTNDTSKAPSDMSFRYYNGSALAVSRSASSTQGDAVDGLTANSIYSKGYYRSGGFMPGWKFLSTISTSAPSPVSTIYIDENKTTVLGTSASDSPLLHVIYYSKAVQEYNIALRTAANGTAIASATSAIYNATVTITFTPDTGYMVDWDNVSVTSTVAVALVQTSDTTATFTMPAADVTIYPAFVQALTAGVQVSGGHGTATVSNAHPDTGDTVTITCYPDSGYEVDTVTSFDATISQVATNQYQFTMPNVDVLATVTFKETPFFNITCEAASNGSVSASPSSGYSGTTITLTVAPDTGYSLRSLYVLAGTDSVPTTKVDDTHYTFTLPSFNIVVRARFTDGDPYSPGGNSEPSTPEGTGSFDDETMPITPPAIPSVSVQDSGLYTIFSLRQSDLNDFTNYLWSDLFSLPTVTKYLNNATEHILSLHILPFTVDTDSPREIKFMGIGTGASGYVVSRQHQQIDCGSVLLEEYYGSALDYNPWTKLKLYVPYCGEIELDPDEVMGKAVSLKYTVDILTGDCYANVSVSGTTMYQLSGNCAMRLPVSASNWSSVLRAAASGLTIAAGVGAAAMGAVGAGLTAVGASTISSAYAGGGPAMDPATMDAGLATMRAGQAVTERTPSVGSTNSYMATMSQKSSFVHTGVQTGGASFMAVQVPYILIKRPRQALPENFNHYVGYPAHYTRTLGNMSGFTQIIDWNPSSIPCTEYERTEIDRLLKEGVIL